MKKTKMKAIMGIAVAMAMTVSSLTACGGTKETKAATVICTQNPGHIFIN